MFFICVILAAWAVGLRAQDYLALDGPALNIKPDTVSINPRLFPMPSLTPAPGLPAYLAPPVFETKEQRAARINARVQADLMQPVRQNLQWIMPPMLSRKEQIMLRVAGLFLTSPYKIPDGCVPVMNPSNPFVFLKTPGQAPYEHPYSPENFPQCIRAEYDFASGTYKQVMVPWDSFAANMNRSFGGPYIYAPVPRMYFTSTERVLQ